MSKKVTTSCCQSRPGGGLSGSRKTYPELERKADAEGTEIFWCDETRAFVDAYSGGDGLREIRGGTRNGGSAAPAHSHEHDFGGEQYGFSGIHDVFADDDGVCCSSCF